MTRKVFFSFHFDADSWRASKVRQMGALEGNEPVSGNDWETVKRGGDVAIERWIASQMSGRTCAVVLVGAQTASRPWVKYEIRKAWERGLGVVGVRIHGLTDQNLRTATPGANPFAGFNLSQTSLSQIVPLHDPAGLDSKAVYASIEKNLDAWVEDAIRIRAKY
ncbi:hypothetical protein CFB89_14495 [Burkholderia sp. AU16741]|uniref:TIR domain-containing protein n=1 Tax=unclassified Burkholderia TaxID=2613784 RepID=UPI000B7A60BB|nr:MULTISPECIES: TIR domain-containing protein [unclassified Burkholderia]MDN7429923.1 TIR domain-containing protein [Burkholderia sp. AU45388]OXI32333.1 hypothetical protein CFB89_14495 [Burkholderia sp. AU16741]